jgi:hypothetical protein
MGLKPQVDFGGYWQRQFATSVHVLHEKKPGAEPGRKCVSYRHRNCRLPVELSGAVFESDDVGVSEAARHGADDFCRQPQVAGMLRAIVG